MRCYQATAVPGIECRHSITGIRLPHAVATLIEFRSASWNFWPLYSRCRITSGHYAANLGKKLPSSVIMLLYKSYIRPTVEYAVSVWCFKLPSTILSELDVLQAKICRRYLRNKKISFAIYETKESLNMKCNLQSLKYRRQFLSIIILFKFIHYHAEYLCKFNLAVSKSARRPNKLVINSHGTQLSSLFLLKTAKLWNCLPPDITSLENLTAFKKRFRAHTYKYCFDCNGIPF